ncbi:alpha,alpha-trehalase TreF [Marivirga sp. S37H4]|uniref:Alpha,alpha-trehalase TreF n=1 Tax=Marivirga aurantiaca TaxID=2802615 RepID=A0A934X021_9BACT|nr:alpha,alpha-trehalase TreF [Marivirga aurantiaca]MBK6266393.1 alpha,alpha-trehalase TreF [Marivirga aurantiaca]
MKKYLSFLIVPLFFVSCGQQAEHTQKELSPISHEEFYATEFFKAVQMADIYEDSKTFVDCVAKKSLATIVDEYETIKDDEDFDMKEFVHENFNEPEIVAQEFVTDTSLNIYEHINNLWPVLTRGEDEALSGSSLIPLPYKYVVPGGRFREIYYWDSYFTLLGLKANGKDELALNMVDNFAFLIDSLGFVPNGNRAYYIGRSQPPFFAFMVDLVAGKNRDLFIKYQPQLLNEYNFWMDGADRLTDSSSAMNRSVLLLTGEVLNRYYDQFTTPRPESFKEDYLLAEQSASDKSEMYRNLRAGAESGWDYSSRWLADQQSLQSIHTTDIIPVDLNALLYFLELKIAQSYNWQGDMANANYYLNKAEQRKNAINSILWNEESRTYMDYDFKAESHTGVVSMAMAYPLFVQIAPKDKARMVVELMNDKLLKPGGLVTSDNNTGQQWDYPNGWAPLQWIGMQSLFNYGYSDEGLDVVDRWLSLNKKIFRETGKMMEKYNVSDTTLQAGGGEYPLQDGFGWTNGVAVAMQEILNRKEKTKEAGLVN